MPKEESFSFSDEVHRRYRTTKTSLDVMLEKQMDDYWNVDEERELSDARTGYKRFILLNERPPDGHTWSGRDLRGNKRPQDSTMCGWMCGSICLMQRKAKKSKTGLSRNPSSKMPVQIGTQDYSDASSIYKIPDAKGAVEKVWANFEKIPAWQLTEVRNKREVIDEARNEGRGVQFASLMDLCHLKNSELEPQYQ